MTILGLIISVVFYEIDMVNYGQWILGETEEERLEELDKPYYESYRWDHESQLSRIVVLAISVASVVCYGFRQYYKNKWFVLFTQSKKQKSGIMYNYYGEKVTKCQHDHSRFDVRKNHCSRFFLLEVLILLLCPIPYWDFYVSIDYYRGKTLGTDIDQGITINQLFSDYILCFMFLRLFFLFRAMFNYSIYSDAYSRKVCK